jgi:glucuronoarabinoxylan endo-1,4-beta-xylanase
LGSSIDIVTAAEERLGRSPTIILSSTSPPDSLKANGSSWCEGNPDSCTLVTLPDGSFDYAGFASYWRSSLDAYALASIVPDYISIQNNPNWVPGVGTIVEACRFLPTEGTQKVATDTGAVTVQYPGYAEALAAVVGQFEGLASIPRIVAPDTSNFTEVADYVADNDIANVDAFAHHMYGTNATNVDPNALEALSDLAEQNRRPLFQTEMSADAATTAVLMHAALAIEGAVVYLQAGFVGSAYRIEPDRTTLINMTDDDFVIGDPYHVMLHYSAHIDSGWVRVAANSDADGLLASAWVSPEGDAVAVVLTNRVLAEKAVRIDIGDDTPKASTVTRTVLNGRERSAQLGPLSPEGIVTLPGQSLVTVTIQR